ncbi:zinc finger protein Xfin isoform X2 [Anabas testudineus]|nr:zinc finger protein Xfin isoform X2 [Anabas testudineus]
MFPLKGGSVDLSCPIDPPATQEEMAQSAHLMSLGLCRISATKPPPPPPAASSCSLQDPSPPEDSPCLSQTDSLKQSVTDARKSPPSSRRRLPCLLCPLTLTSRWLLDVHVRSHCATGGFSCVCCSWTADSWEELEPHWRSHSSSSRGRRRRRVEQKQEKKQKKKAAATLTPFRCPVCRRTFRNAASRNAHQQTHKLTEFSDVRLIGRAGVKDPEDSDSQTSRPHAEEKKKKKKKRKKKKVTTRRKSEEEEAEQAGFCCSLCLRKFASKLTLRRHLGIHGGEKPFTCPHCSYSSRLKASLLQHLRTHTGEKPYRCADCSYASIDRSSLLRHSRTHSQEKPYRCQRCDYSSIQKKSLDLHARRHHTGEAFPCLQCKYSSPDRQLLLRHVRRHHAHCDNTAERTL